MKTFTMYRRNVPDATHNADQKNAPDQPQFEGVVFDDGSVAIRWMTAKRSTAIWASLEDMLAIHGHPEYGSELIWSPSIDDDTKRMPITAYAFEVILAALKYDGPDINSLTVGEIRRALP